MQNRSQSQRLSAMQALGILALLVAVPVFADTSVLLDLPAQPLAESIRAVARATNSNVVFDSSIVAGRTAPALKTQATVEQALQLLLQGTGLGYKRYSDQALRVATEAELERADAPKVSPRSEVTPSATAPTTDNSVLEEILVTGTHLRGEAPVGSPLRTVNRAEIERSGYTATEQLIQALPQNFRGGASGATPDGSFGQGVNAAFNSTYGAGVNLRGLGNTATLVLVNGHRTASSGSGYYTDISTIPVAAIERIDVLTDGASAIYGSEAIGGVINIILKKEAQGVETSIRHGLADGLSSSAANVQLGGHWTGGGGLFGIDVSRQSTLDASERAFTAAIASPETMFPKYTQTALDTAVHHEITGNLELHADAQYAHKEVTAFQFATYRYAPTVERWSAAGGADYRLSGAWTLHYEASGGEQTERLNIDNWSAGGATSPYARGDIGSRFLDHNLTASGELFALPAGPVQLALGAAHRSESYRAYINTIGLDPSLTAPDRKVTAGFAEMRIPVVSEANGRTGVRRLTLSLAGRYDHYSDFGNTTNPKYGVSWYPLESLELRAAYSTSFRAPSVGTELANSELGVRAGIIRAFPGPGGVGEVPVAYINGGDPDLQPETARNLTVGLSFRPPFRKHLELALNYYDIEYSNQISNPPFSFDALNDPAYAAVLTRYPDSSAILALVDDVRRRGGTFRDFTFGAFGPDPFSQTVYLLDLGTQNISSTDTRGLDLSVSDVFALGADRLGARIDVSYIDRFITAITPGAPPVDQVNTVGFPSDLRIRAQADWTHRGVNLALAANYIGGYPDNSAPAPRDVAAYLTFDVTVRYDLSGLSETVFRDTDVTLVANNVFDRLPPYVTAGGLFEYAESHYDPANADPRGRFIALTLGKRW